MNKIKLIEYEIFENNGVSLVFSGMENYYKDKLIGEFIISKLTNGKYKDYKMDDLSFEYQGKNKIHIYNPGDIKISPYKTIYSYDKKTYVTIPNDLVLSVIPKLGLIINKINKNYNITNLINEIFNIGEK